MQEKQPASTIANAAPRRLTALLHRICQEIKYWAKMKDW